MDKLDKVDEAVELGIKQIYQREFKYLGMLPIHWLKNIPMTVKEKISGYYTYLLPLFRQAFQEVKDTVGNNVVWFDNEGYQPNDEEFVDLICDLTVNPQILWNDVLIRNTLSPIKKVFLCDFAKVPNEWHYNYSIYTMPDYTHSVYINAVPIFFEIIPFRDLKGVFQLYEKPIITSTIQMYSPEYLRDRGFFIEGSVKNDVPCLLIEQETRSLLISPYMEVRGL